MDRARLILTVLLGAVVGITPVAYAQQTEFPNARPPWESASGGAVASRTPGRMVRQGTARFRDAHAAALNRARNGPTITQRAPQDHASQLNADLLSIVFQDLNVALAYLGQAFLQGGSGSSGGNGSSTPDQTEPATDVSPLLGTISGPQGD